MTERLLQYIWQFQYFNTTSLTTAEGEPLQIIHPGIFNHDQGPDFTAARIQLGNTTWVGSIELHINSSGWNDHRHSEDKNYNNVILHVVWQHDMEPGLAFPTLVLQDRISSLLLTRYEELMHAATFIPCEKNIQGISNLHLRAWQERLLVERLQEKAGYIFDLLATNHTHWELTCWWLIARNFGSTVNAAAFEAIARSIPVALLAKHRNNLLQLEALLFGQAGLLQEDYADEYPKVLQQEYKFLSNKYALAPIQQPMLFLRMRPPNFPTVRLAQLAVLVHESEQLFSKMKEAVTVKDIKSLLQVSAGDYWLHHYVFDEPAASKKKNLGEAMIGNIIINTVVPLVFAYGLHQNEVSYKTKALQWLEDIRAEQNIITRGFASIGIKAETAFDSQALIQLKHRYCDKKRCLDCGIGNKLLNYSQLY